MAGGQSWRQNITGTDVFTDIDKRLGQQERRASPRSAADTLGPGMSARAVQILDWNADEALYNGYYWSIPGALHSPDPDIQWTGHSISKDDGSGLQQVWNVDPETGIATWMRTWVTGAVSGVIEFGEWRRFATSSGMIGEDDLDQPVLDNIQEALDLAAESFNFGGQANRVFRQNFPPYSGQVSSVWAGSDSWGTGATWGEHGTAPAAWGDSDSWGGDWSEHGGYSGGTGGDGYTLRIGDVWFDTSDNNRPRWWDGDSWEDARDGTIEAAMEAANYALYAEIDGIRIRVGTIAGTKITDGGISTPQIATNAVTAQQITARAITSKHTITGAVFQTETEYQRGIKITNAGMFGYDTNGIARFVLTTAGALAITGSISAGSFIDGSIITGGTVQSESTPMRGIKFNSAGLAAYDSGGSATLTINAATGVVLMRGDLTSGSTITGASITGGTLSTRDEDGDGVDIADGMMLFTTGAIINTWESGGEDGINIASQAIGGSFVQLTNAEAIIGAPVVRVDGDLQIGPAGRVTSGVYFGVSSATTDSDGQTTTNHNLGVIPLVIFAQPTNSGFGGRSTQVIEPDTTSTQFTVQHRNVAGAALAGGSTADFMWLAILA